MLLTKAIKPGDNSGYYFNLNIDDASMISNIPVQIMQQSVFNAQPVLNEITPPNGYTVLFTKNQVLPVLFITYVDAEKIQRYWESKENAGKNRDIQHS